MILSIQYIGIINKYTNHKQVFLIERFRYYYIYIQISTK